MAEDEGACWGCGHHRRPHRRGLCRACYKRWCYRGFTGPGPSYLVPRVAGRLEDHAQTITTRTAAQAAEQIGVHKRTIQRWRRALRQGAS